MNDTLIDSKFDSVVPEPLESEEFTESAWENSHGCIMVGVDYSSCGDNAARVAAHLSKIYQKRVVCLHIFERRIMRDLANSTAAIGKIGLAAHRYLDSHVNGIMGNVEVVPKVVVGDPLDEILREIDNEQPQISILGSRALCRTDTRLRSGLALRCVEASTSDVLVVRPGQCDPFRSVVVGVNFSSASMLAVRVAVDIARSSGASLEFLHVLPSPVASGKENIGSLELKALKCLEAWLRKVIGIDHKGLQIRCTIRKGHDIGTTLVNHLTESRAELVVMGASTSISGNSVIALLAERAPSSILSVKLPKVG